MLKLALLYALNEVARAASTSCFSAVPTALAKTHQSSASAGSSLPMRTSFSTSVPKIFKVFRPAGRHNGLDHLRFKGVPSARFENRWCDREGYGCNGRALDRVTKQKRRPNVQKLSENRVCSPSGHFLHIFRTFFHIFRTSCRHSLFLGCPTICPVQGYGYGALAMMGIDKRNLPILIPARRPLPTIGIPLPPSLPDAPYNTEADVYGFLVSDHVVN